MGIAPSWVALVALFQISAHAGARGSEGSNVAPEDLQDSGIHFPVSCHAQSQSAFDEGLFLLHNMMYQQAEAAFETAAKADGDCAMLFWGAAMSQFHPKWPGDPTPEALAKGEAAVARAVLLAQRHPVSETERGHIEAAAAYYDDWRNANREQRRLRWRVALEELASRYPQDSEAQAFLGLAELTTAAPTDLAALASAAERLEAVRVERPRHPGVLHYLLHAYDNPVHARLGIPAAVAYEAVAPDAPHALHMPSHLYVRLGDWKQVIAWNIRSRDAAARQPVDGRVSRHFLHALDYLVYGYLQLGDDVKAREEAARANAATAWQINSGPAAYALAAVPARVALERRAWPEAASLEPRAVPYAWDGYPWAEAVTYAARGLGATRTGDAAAARKAIAQLERLQGRTSNAWWQGRIGVERDVIAAWIAHLEGESEVAVELLSTAAERELEAGKQSVEPGHVLYAIEQLGDLLLELDRPDAALSAFQLALEDSPRRFRSLFGAGRAAEAAGMQTVAREYYSALTEIAIASDRPEVKRAASFLAQQERRGSSDSR